MDVFQADRKKNKPRNVETMAIITTAGITALQEKCQNSRQGIRRQDAGDTLPKRITAILAVQSGLP